MANYPKPKSDEYWRYVYSPTERKIHRVDVDDTNGSVFYFSEMCGVRERGDYQYVKHNQDIPDNAEICAVCVILT